MYHDDRETLQELLTECRAMCDAALELDDIDELNTLLDKRDQIAARLRDIEIAEAVCDV